MVAALPAKEHIEALESSGLVTVRPHNTLPLRIVNYTPQAQYSRAWTPELLQCRGLIFDHEWNLVARPFPKFFNYEEHIGDEPVAGPLPSGFFTATDKLDGSLGILWRWNGHVGIATRGSFHSEQAEEGSKMLRDQYTARDIAAFGECTHLFEIIYPANRIVVDYGGLRKLAYLGSINKATGADEWHGEVFGGEAAVQMTLDELMVPRKNAEGYVLRYENGQRVKIKHEEYVNLHRIVTGLSTTSIWEHLSSGGSIKDLLDPLPDEWMKWAEKEAIEMIESHNDVLMEATTHYSDIVRMLEAAGDTSRKEFALLAKAESYNPSLLFMLLDGNMDRLNEAAWKAVKPERKTPTTGEEC